MTSFNQNQIRLNDPCFAGQLKTLAAENLEKFLSFSKECFHKLEIADFDVIIHYNIVEIFDFLILDRKRMIDETKNLNIQNEALKAALEEFSHKVDEFAQYCTRQEQMKTEYDNVINKYKQVLLKNEKLRNEKTKDTRIIDGLNRKIERLNKTIYDLSNNNEKAFADERKLQEKLEEKIAECTKLQKKFGDLEEKIKEKEDHVKSIEDMLVKEREEHEKAIKESSQRLTEQVEQLRRELQSKMDVKDVECSLLKKQLENTHETVKKLKSKQDELLKEHEASSTLLETQIKELQKAVDERTTENQKLVDDLKEMKQKIDEFNKKKSMLNALVKESGNKAASLNEQQKEKKEIKMIKGLKSKKEENHEALIKKEVAANNHEECLKQIQHLTAELAVKKELLVLAEKKCKNYEEKRDSLLKQASSNSLSLDEVIDITGEVGSPKRKRQRKLHDLLQQQPHVVPTTSFMSNNHPSPSVMQQQQQFHHHPYGAYPQFFNRPYPQVVYRAPPPPNVVFNQQFQVQQNFSHPFRPQQYQETPYFENPGMNFVSSAPQYKAAGPQQNEPF